MHAVVELKPHHAASTDELRALVRDQIGAVSAPKAIEFVPSLPRSATGKVLKRELRARYWQNKDRAI